MKTAVVIGATGLVGRELVKRLADSSQYAQVLAICRQQQSWPSSQVRTLVFDFQNWQDLEVQIKNLCSMNETHCFCALGTTIRQAGSKEAFKKVDLVYPVLFAKLASRVGAEKLLVVSAMGALAESKVFYNQVKGQMEAEVSKVFNRQLAFCRPSLLLGNRQQFRFGEKIAEIIYWPFSPIIHLIFKKYQPIQANQVALAMQKIAESRIEKNIYDNLEMIQISEKNKTS